MFGDLTQPILPIQSPVIFHGSQLSGYQKAVHATGPLAYWPLDESSGTTVFDRSGHGFHGTYNGAALANAPAPGGGMAPYFDGLNDRADMQPADLLAALNHAEFTMMAWVKVFNLAVWSDGAYREAFHIRVNVTNRAYMIKPTTANRFQFVYNGNSATTKQHDWTAQSSVEWLHLVLTVSVAANQMNSYINGTAWGAPASGITAYAGTPSVGVACDGAAAWWKGWLAHAAIWNRALTPAEVAALFAAGSS